MCRIKTIRIPDQQLYRGPGFRIYLAVSSAAEVAKNATATALAIAAVWIF